ncbi:MAG TPA: glycosyltransferase family 2 protein [Patescibacteria group bacterium]|nr:glycosyltransferase family 2 protein [Patescibacteria group bacterium]
MIKRSLPRITIITPSFNQGGFIGQTIESVLNQGYPNLEYIVMDGGSTDGTLDVLRSYGNWITWFSEKDHGQSHAINKGLRMATGEVIAYLNSDDLYEPGALLKVGDFFSANPEAAWLTGRCRIVDQEGREIRKSITAYKNFWLRLNNYKVLLVLNYISQPATFWRRNVIEIVGDFDETLRYAMDYDYSLRVGRHFKPWMVHKYLASFRVHPASKAGSYAYAQFISDLEIANRYTASPLLRGLHVAHNALIVAVYRLLFARREDSVYLITSKT